MGSIYNYNGIRIYVFPELGTPHKERHIHIYYNNIKLNLLLNDPQVMLNKIRCTFTGQIADYVEILVFGNLERLHRAINDVEAGKVPEKLEIIPISALKQKHNPVVKKAKELIKQTVIRLNESCDMERRLVSIETYKDFTMDLEYSDGSLRTFDFVPLIEQYVWAKPLGILRYFLEARLDSTVHNVVYWGDYFIEIDACDLYRFSKPRS